MNTILVSHTVGITVTSGSTARLEATLWGNDADWGGAGTIITGNINVWGDPAFVNPQSGDYHIGPTSAAVDRGIPTDISSDIDGEFRPMGFGSDLGVDERPSAYLLLHKVAWPPFVVGVGQTLTYRVAITNAGINTATHVILTDTLPMQQKPLTITVTQGNCVPGTAWGSDVICTLDSLASGRRIDITLTTQVTPAWPADSSPIMRNVVWVTATETANTTQAKTLLNNCRVRLNEAPTEYDSVQAAVDASMHPTDVVKIAGYCAGVNTYGGLRQQVYLSKTLTLQGGYTFADWTTSDPLANSTTLDAVGQGRVFYIIGHITPTIEGLYITGGDASGLVGGGYPAMLQDAGGGMYVITAAVTLSDNQVFSNTADDGGGLYLLGNNAVLSATSVISNSARHFGGGLYLSGDDAVLNGNSISANSAEWYGGGLFLESSNATLNRNTVAFNTAGYGGGLWQTGNATLNGNILSANTASYGGGAYLGTAILNSNIISANIAGYGGGLYLVGANSSILNGNTVLSNTANFWGGGMFLSSSQATVVNTIIADNRATVGGGLYIEFEFFTSTAGPRLLHSTLARNVGGGVCVGTYCDDYGCTYGIINVTNTIIVSNTVGINVAEGNTARLEATLWGNDTDWAGSGKIMTGTVNIWGNPAFVDPDAGDYHIGPDSAAIKKGISAGVRTDIDNQPRPEMLPDLGADEYWPPDAFKYSCYLPVLVKNH
jgi:uncharacterized repeat protein (TIGR01451 family)